MGEDRLAPGRLSSAFRAGRLLVAGFFRVFREMQVSTKVGCALRTVCDGGGTAFQALERPWDCCCISFQSDKEGIAGKSGRDEK
jgi:hypothetical protein